MGLRNELWLVGVIAAGCGDDVTGSGSASTGVAETGSSGGGSSGGETQVPTTGAEGTVGEGMSTGTSGGVMATTESSSGGTSTGEGGTSTGESSEGSSGDGTTGALVCADPAESMGGAISFGGLGGEQALGFAVGLDGSRYSGGVFFGPSVDLMPGGGAVFPAQGNSGNMWLNKVAGDDSYVYGYTWPTIDGYHCYVWGFAPDADGSVYVVGHFVGDLDLDPTAGVDMHKAGDGAGDLAGFLIKLGAEGAYLWGRHWGSSETTAFGIARAGDGSLYVTGYFDGEVDLDPGPGVDVFMASGVGNATDGYLSKFDGDGEYLWGRTWGAGGEVYSYEVAVDADGNPVVSGTAGGPADLDPGPGVQVHDALGLADTFIESFMADGTWRWGFAVGGDSFDEFNDIAVDPLGRVWAVGGTASTSIDLDPGPGNAVQPNLGAYDGVVGRYTAEGEFDAAFVLAGTDHDNLWGVAIDCQGSVYIAGHFSGVVDLDPGQGEEPHVSAGASEAFIVALEPDDTYRWSRSWQNVESGVAQAVGLDGDQMLHGQINFYGQIDADASMGVEPFAANGDQDVLLQRLRPGSGGW